MNSWLKQLWHSLWEGLWFVPGLITASGLLAGVLLSGIAGWRLPGKVDKTAFDPDAAGGVLTALGAGSITVAAVVLSITMVVLSSASAQFGPRLLPNFLRKTGTKLAAGGFIGAFAYQMVTASALALGEKVPDLAVWVGIVGGLGSFAILLAFVHMVSRFIQVAYIIDEVTGDLQQALMEFVGHRTDDRGNTGDDLDPTLAKLGEVNASTGGYVQRIDVGPLCQQAEKRNLLIRSEVRAGKFVARGSPLATVFGVGDTDCDELAEGFVIGPNRTAQQDVEFAIRQLVEIAAKALSPGINDPYTAINALERLGGALAEVIGDALPPGQWRDGEGVVRLTIPLPDALNLLDAAYLPLRQHARTQEAVAIALMDSFLLLARHRPHPDFALALLHHAGLLKADFEERVSNERDTADFRERYERLLGILAEGAGKFPADGTDSP